MRIILGLTQAACLIFPLLISGAYGSQYQNGCGLEAAQPAVHATRPRDATVTCTALCKVSEAKVKCMKKCYGDGTSAVEVVRNCLRKCEVTTGQRYCLAECEA